KILVPSNTHGTRSNGTLREEEVLELRRPAVIIMRPSEQEAGRIAGPGCQSNLGDGSRFRYLWLDHEVGSSMDFTCAGRPAPAAALRNAYQSPDSVRVYGPWKGKLKNGEDRITVKDKNGVVVCTVKYGDRGHWPRSADGAGHALVLKNPNRSIDDWRNWAASE